MTGFLANGHYCDRCEDSGVVPAGEFGDGDRCPNCDGDPLNALPHEDRPHPPDYDCPDCAQDTGTDDDLQADGGLEEVFRRETIQRCECGAATIGDCDCPEDDDLVTDGGQPLVAVRYPDGSCPACGFITTAELPSCPNCAQLSSEERGRDV